MTKPAFFIVLSVTLILKGYSQRFIEPDKMKAFNITVNYPEYTVKTQMLKEPKKMTPDVNLTYHWYTSQKIMETKGGFDGKLLHGYYRSFYLNDQLFESGEFKYGVKSGEWKNWYPDGKIKEITHWKNGTKNGKYALYNDDGNLMASGNFKEDLLTGTFKTYDISGKVSSLRKYKTGKELIKKEKTSKTKKDNTKESDSSGSGNSKKKQSDKEQSKPNASSQPEKKSFGQKLKSFFKGKSKTEDPKPAKKTVVTT